MPDGVKKGITVKVDAGLHAEVSAYIREHGMTMSEFVALALDNELHPKITEKEGNNMANTRTVAFQVPEEMFQRIKDYLQRNNMTQKQFLLGLIERELDREQSVREGENGEFERESEQDEEEPDYSENGAVDDFEGNSDEDEYDEEDSEFDDEESDDEDFTDDESEDEGYEMSM
ncbi:hypothetical protein [uncultured Ruminococcus sp.]|jgi:hypothetical protein|uniref:hypothetical protein n=1 Tax=Ruminococcus sp. TaxID=41978 RepID=UPI00292FBF14|nr:hypothetical protein [uncultured Ruminococcus sp.]MBQ2570058.1 hypothetical protein [Ruminococcus sp.]